VAPRLFYRALDALDYFLTSMRMHIVDWVFDPEPETLADEIRRRRHEQLRDAFPDLDIDGTESGRVRGRSIGRKRWVY
jgi:hypothetical protein